MEFELNDTVTLIFAAIIVVLSIAVYVIYFMQRDHLTVSNVENDVIMRTGGSAGSTVVNMQDFTQPGQGPQLRTPSYDRLWMNNFPSRYSGDTEPFVNMCSNRDKDNNFLAGHLNLRTPDGRSIYRPEPENISGRRQNGRPLLGQTISSNTDLNKLAYENCIRQGGSPTECSVQFSKLVDSALSDDAWSK